MTSARGDAEQRFVGLAVEAEQHSALADQVDQLLELVGVVEIPHRHPQDDPVRLLEAPRERADACPDRRFGRVQRFFRHAFVLGADRLAAEFRQVFLPDIQRIDLQRGAGLAVGIDESVGDGDRRGAGAARGGLDVQETHAA